MKPGKYNEEIRELMIGAEEKEERKMGRSDEGRGWGE